MDWELAEQQLKQLLGPFFVTFKHVSFAYVVDNFLCHLPDAPIFLARVFPEECNLENSEITPHSAHAERGAHRSRV